MNISILGCGWLGLPLAKELLKEEEHIIKGSTTSQNKLISLQQEGIIPYRIKILPEGIEGDLTSFLADAEVLIIDFPPGLRRDPEADFLGKLKKLKLYLDKSTVNYTLLVSSTAVYKDKEEFPTYTEIADPNGTAENSKQIIAAEELLRSCEYYSTTIIRFGGLIGPNRHPVNYLSGKSGIKDPEAPVNLIHREDCIGIIKSVINKGTWGETINAVAPDHPSREDYYSRLAKEKNLALPEFDQVVPSKGKIIGSVVIKEKLEYQFKQGIN